MQTIIQYNQILLLFSFGSHVYHFCREIIHSWSIKWQVNIQSYKNRYLQKEQRAWAIRESWSKSMLFLNEVKLKKRCSNGMKWSNRCNKVYCLIDVVSVSTEFDLAAKVKWTRLIHLHKLSLNFIISHWR